jgi:hypothetical protein
MIYTHADDDGFQGQKSSSAGAWAEGCALDTLIVLCIEVHTALNLRLDSLDRIALLKEMLLKRLTFNS